METLGKPMNEQKYYCEFCDYLTCRYDNFQKHVLTDKHNVSICSQSRSKKVGDAVDTSVYVCDYCDYNTSRKTNYDRHLLSAQHVLKSRSQDESREQNVTPLDVSMITDETALINLVEKGGDISLTEDPNKCPTCNKVFQTRSGAWKHKSKCAAKGVPAALTNDVLKMILDSNTHMANALVQSNQNSLQNNTAMMDKIVEAVCKHMQTNNTMNNSHNTTHTNSHNKTFNLQFFLNETCKDALNLSEFIESVQSSFDDIEKIGNLGYTNGLSDFIIKKLNDVGVEKRPIHCTDAKRQTIYYKEDNIWNKEDDDRSHLQVLVDSMQKTNLRELQNWKKKYPSCLTSTSIYTDTYNNMSHELMGGTCTKVKLAAKDYRIMNKIAQHMVIDKSLYIS